jgi:hypothetical protein
VIRPGHFFDGRIFEGSLLSAAGHTVPDIVSFRDGKIRSKFFSSHGYLEVSYEAMSLKDASEAERFIIHITFPKQGVDEYAKFHGVIEGDNLHSRITVIKEGREVAHFVFDGSSHQMRYDTMPLGA